MTTTIVFDHHQRKNKDGMGTIEVRYDDGGNKYYISTGIRVKRENFVGGAVVNQVDAQELNDRLGIIYRRIQAELNRYIMEGVEPDVDEIRRRVWKPSNEESTIIDFIKEQEGMMQVRSGTLKHYATLRTRLDEFGEIVKWSDLTTENIYRWDAWLHTLKNKDGNPISDGGVYNYHKCLKAIISRAVLFDKITRNPYDLLKGKFKRGDVKRLQYLTDEEMKAVEAIHPLPGSQMGIVRDLFVFQMHTGLSFADIQAFDFNQYQQINGKWVNIGSRVKTGVQYITQLSSECLDILRRYDNQLPQIENGEYNRLLKYLGQVAGIEKPLHSHLARHSFATNMMANGAPIQNVAKMLGHTNIAQTQRYAKVLIESIMGDFDKLEK